ncbi:MAG: RNA-directed DNA polymerase, partial [Colwellia sp.]|nr:RNA-directed DNA polymerase [Colwellia sp.]
PWLLAPRVEKLSLYYSRIEEIMSIVAGKRFYTRLDARCAFHQIPVSPKSQPITAFTCVIGQFEFTVTPQGLKISPGIFQSFADKLFIGLHEFVLPYMDDYIIFSNKLEEHLKHIEKCFQRIEKSNIKLKRSKCLFAKRKIKFLGFVISLYGLALDEEKVSAITQMTIPQTVRAVRRILGATSYYRRHIINYSKLCEPLIELTKEYTTQASTQAPNSNSQLKHPTKHPQLKQSNHPFKPNTALHSNF